MKNLLPVLFALLILSSCRKKEESIAVESVAIDKGKTAEVRLGETLQLKATVLPENATSKELVWSSTALSKATVSEGLVTPLEEGETLISATAGGVTDNCTVTVLPKFVAVAGISVDPTTENILIGRQSTLKATITPENASDKTVVWSSDNENIATVSNGVITPKAVGTCTITAKSFSDQTKVAICAVTVVDQEIPVNGISLIPSANILMNDTRELTVIFDPKNTTHKNVTWSTSDAAVADVSADGVVAAKSVVRAKSMGSADVTVASAADPSKTGVCKVTVTNQAVAVTGISAASTDTTIAVKTSFQLRHRIEPANATHVNVTYESSDDTKATVSESGLVTANAIGEASITVKSAADPTKVATRRLVIKARITSIIVSPNTVTILAGQKRPLTATVIPFDVAIKTVTWSSADPSKATVSKEGEVTAVGLGQVVITATARDGSNIIGSSTITVVTDVAGVSLDPTEVGIIVGETKTIVATIAPATATNKRVVWISDQENIATVSEGIITARAVGTCTITAKSASDPNKMATCAVTITAQAILVTSISVTPASANILVNGTRQLTAEVLPENATNKDVTWSTSNTAIAEVSTAGLVTAKSAGTATITATSVSNSAKTATCAITVTNQAVAVTGITATPADTTIIVGASFQLRHSIEPANATNVNVTYECDAEKALVSEIGLVTARAIGQTTITVKSAADPSKTATCVLTINPAPVLVQSITVSPNAVTLSAGQNRQLTATVLPANATNKTVTWSSADASKATVSNSGEVTAVGAGQVVITATANDGSAVVGNANRATVTVLPRATSITITPENPTVTIGATLVLNATVLPAGAVQTVTWSSGDPTKATINPTTGAVSGVGAGTVTITATATDGSGVTREVALTVQALVSNAAITNFTIRSADFILGVPNPRATTTVNHAPRSLATSLTSVEVEITATEGAIIKIGTTDFSGQRVNCTNPVTFTVTEAGKTGSKAYTLTIPSYSKSNNPYGIYSIAHLHDMRNALNEGFKLMHDLTMPASSTGFPGISDYGTEGWLPIGGKDNPFTGSMDGAGHTIDNLYAHRKTLSHVGLFGKVGAEGTIKNLEVNTTEETDKGVFGEYRTGRQYCGILAGQNQGTIEDCHTTGKTGSSAITTDHAHAGGLVGAHTGGEIRKCYSTARVTGIANEGAVDCFAGGLVGYNSANISDCYATGDVYAFGTGNTNSSSFSGGLLGACRGGSVNRCYATGNIYAISSATSGSSSKGSYAGGLMGHCNAQINNCYATGTVRVSATDYNYVMMAGGGFVGHASGGSISNSYAIGDVYSTVGRWDYTYLGGFCGYYQTTFTNCYRNWDAYTRAEKRLTTKWEVTPWDKGIAGISAEYLADMKTDAQKNKLNQGQSAVWGRAGEKNSNLPYLMGVGVGK